MAKQLVVIEGPDKGQRFPLMESAPLSVGRGRQALARLNDLNVSRLHCQITNYGDRLVLTDAGSLSGTFVNGQRVGTEQPLLVGDVVRLGGTQLRVEEDDVADQATLAPTPPAAPGPAPAGENLGDLQGQTLGHYQVGPARAQGRTGVVFRARDIETGEDVALKILRPQFLKHEEAVKRFFRATKTVLPLHHPNLVTLHEAGQNGNFCWIAMDWVEGESLTQVIDRIGVANMLDWRYGLRVAIHVGRALQFAHEKHIIHRNLTPQNVLVRESDRCTLLGDLVLAKALDGVLAQQITRPGEIIGDVRYMPPERIVGNEPVDARSDIYSLGALVYALLTGRPPFVGATLIDTLGLIRMAEPARPKKYQMSISDLFEGVVLKMLAKRPEERFQTAGDLLAQLDLVCKYQGVQV
jgi:serine/threonine protein kinase